MHEIAPRYRAYSTELPLFHIASLSKGLQDGPMGVWIETEYVKQNPVLRAVVRNGVNYKFVAHNPLFGVSEQSPLALILKITQRTVPNEGVFGNAAVIHLYAEVLETGGTTRTMLEAAVEFSPEPPEVRQLAESLATTGFQLTCEFINVLRRSHSQYWLTHPNENSMGWGTIAYYSHPRDKWYSIILEDDFRSRVLTADPTGGPSRGPILLGMITATNGDRLQAESADTDYSFADEMVSIALIELGQSRFRSAIVHAVIALESSSKAHSGKTH